MRLANDAVRGGASAPRFGPRAKRYCPFGTSNGCHACPSVGFEETEHADLHTLGCRGTLLHYLGPAGVAVSFNCTKADSTTVKAIGLDRRVSAAIARSISKTLQPSVPHHGRT